MLGNGATCIIDNLEPSLILKSPFIVRLFLIL